MLCRDEYLRLISARGSRYGENGGLLDLLNWCGKLGVREVTREEARAFWENPCCKREDVCGKTEKTGKQC